MGENNDAAWTPSGLAEIIQEAFKADDPFAHIQPADLDGRTCIDGNFDLRRVAKRILNAVERSNQKPV